MILEKNYIELKKGSEEEREKYFAETLQNNMFKLTKLLNKSGLLKEISVQYSVGSKLSLADIVIYHYFSESFDSEQLKLVKKYLAKSIRLTSIIKNVHRIPEIQEWLSLRPDTPF